MADATRRGFQCLAILLATVTATADPPPTSQPAEPKGTTSRDTTTRGTTTQPVSAANDTGTGILAGPRVEPEAMGGTADRPRGDAARAQATIPPRRWFALMREVDLAPAQGRKVRGIVQALQRERRKFEREHGAEFRRLRDEMGKARKTGTPPSEEARARFQKLGAKQPDVEARQETIWKMLTPEQQEAMRREIARVRKEIAERRKKRKNGEMDEATGKSSTKKTDP